MLVVMLFAAGFFFIDTLDKYIKKNDSFKALKFISIAVGLIYKITCKMILSAVFFYAYLV